MCLEWEQTGEWCEMSSDEAGLIVNYPEMRDEGRCVGKGGSRAVDKFWVEFL